jgi:hypothetical protein
MVKKEILFASLEPPLHLRFSKLAVLLAAHEKRTKTPTTFLSRYMN